MFEHHSEPLLSRGKFFWRLGVTFFITLGLAGFSIAIGTLGHRLTEGMTWIESFLRTCLVLADHDVDDHPVSTAGIIFFGIFVLYARLVFVTLIVIVIAPLAHRLLHRLHIPTYELDSES